MKVKILDPRYGDQNVEMTPQQLVNEIEARKESGRLGFVKFDDQTALEYETAKKTGLLEYITEKERQGASATLVPVIAGG